MAENSGSAEAFDEGNGLLATGDFEGAAAAYRRAVACDPAFFDGWHALGMALMKCGELKEAIGCGLQATTLRPNDLLAWTAHQGGRAGHPELREQQLPIFPTLE